MEWYLKVLKNYVGFHGRASRKEFWMFMVINVAFTFGLVLVEVTSNMPAILSTLYSLIVLFPSIAVLVRRLQDTGRSGLWILLSLIPVIGGMILLLFTCEDSQYGENKYGPSPKN